MDPKNDIDLEDKQSLETKKQIFEQSNLYNTCFGALDKRCLNFVASLVFSLITTLFCIERIVGGDADDKQVFVNILTLIVGVYLPQPSHK